MQPHLGEIRMFAGNFVPAGWAFCDGRLLPIAENDVLFNLIGTTYGGDGIETFAVPNLQSRIPVHQGAGTSFSQFGAALGTETVNLVANNLPPHSHSIQGPQMPYRGDGPGNSADPLNNGLGIGTGKKYYAMGTPTGTMGPLSGTLNILPNVGNQPHDNMQPYLCVSFIISLFGIYPQM
ncbi:phage tail protein [Pedobacter nototheniae]|uniref:phage tail protein n=1 Tax=Pedobacter nototheniae TaxID=2488994 RepID=UPI00292EA3EB|nr:tail fiber protein [Pedobacter nototheniae]